MDAEEKGETQQLISTYIYVCICTYNMYIIHS